MACGFEGGAPRPKGRGPVFGGEEAREEASDEATMASARESAVICGFRRGAAPGRRGDRERWEGRGGRLGEGDGLRSGGDGIAAGFDGCEGVGRRGLLALV